MKPEISRMITISTSHITKETAKNLNSYEFYTLDMPISVFDYDYGWFIFVPKHCRNFNNIPDDLRKCAEFAIKNDCEWLRLDCDGIEVDELERYDW